jgi:MFS family permease
VLRLSIALFLVQAGIHGFTASIPLALHHAGRSDAEIGAIVGLAALVQILAAFAGGALIDRLGAMRMFVVGGACYLVASGLLLASGAGAEATILLVVSRVLQGGGSGLVMPAALTFVPGLVTVERRGIAIATAGASHNLTLVVIPPLSIVVLELYGLQAVCLLVGALVSVGLVLVLAKPFVIRASVESGLGVAKRRLGFSFRSQWSAPLLVMTLWVLHWGVLTAYLPQRADAAGTSIGLLFVADGLFVLVARIPAGWVADRIRPIIPVVIGLAMTGAAVLLLLVPPTNVTLILAGTLTGIGAALVVQPLMLALTNRSTDADRGSAFALFNAMFAAGIALGSIGTAPFVDQVGFATLMSIALLAVAGAVAVALADRGMRAIPVRGSSEGATGGELVTDSGTPAG